MTGIRDDVFDCIMYNVSFLIDVCRLLCCHNQAMDVLYMKQLYDGLERRANAIQVEPAADHVDALLEESITSEKKNGFQHYGTLYI